MKQQMGWGAAAAVAIAAAIGLSSLSTSRPSQAAAAGGRPAPIAKQVKAPKKNIHKECSDLIELFHAFLLDENVAGPGFCYDSDGDRASVASKSEDNLAPKFIIATVPDPLHTHFSLLFDRFVEAIQQGAQDEGYQYDSSWLPWETEEPSLTLLGDQDEADDRKKQREDQPGVLLFRAAARNRQSARKPYQTGLFVFIVGEDSTDGIHRKQFENAVAWITALRGASEELPVGILGPTFSGSFPSLAELLSDPKLALTLSAGRARIPKPLAIYSGSVTSKKHAEQFATNPAFTFHSFLQDDNTALDRLCRYLTGNGKKTFNLQRLAILSEDETAYGFDVPYKQQELCPGAPWLYYPRDISTLRSAYQQQSIFNSTATQQNQNTPQRNGLTTDLADPQGKEHDTVRTYAGNQTPLSQEAELLAIVGALRAHRAQYIVLRSSNTLDPLFLANFLRRQYPEARVVILNSDLLFQRGQDALQLNGVMTLSTYPLLSWEPDWTARPPLPIHSHRVFPESSTEGTYVAARLLLHTPALDNDPVGHASCTISDGKLNEYFLPSIFCKPPSEASYVPLPDYAPPFWTQTRPCSEGEPSESCRPAVWLSVITKSGSWPLAALNNNTLPDPDRRALPEWSTSYPQDRREWPTMPFGMKVFLVSLVGFALFHLSCCWFASFTAKPAFRAHFATRGWRHSVLIFMGSFLLALMALIAGWGCGAFPRTGAPLATQWPVRGLVFFVWLVAGLSIVVNAIATRQLNEDTVNRHRGSHRDSRFHKRLLLVFTMFWLSIGGAFLAWVVPIERALILATRIPAYWRSMNLTSGVSPLVPFLSLISGLYIWFWYSLHGLALFGPDRPRLPLRANLIVKVNDGEAKGQELDVLPMFSQECAAEPAEGAATPLAPHTLGFVFILFCIFLGLIVVVVREVPVRSLGASIYAIIFCCWLDFCFSLILGAAWQLWFTWSQLRQLLVFLDRMPLRRTLGALRGFSWGTVWKMSGNVLDVRYKLLSRQLESLNHLHSSLQDLIDTDPDLENDELKGVEACLTAVDKSHQAGKVFAEWYSVNYCKPRASGLRSFDEFQEQIAATAGRVLTDLLAPAWRKEKLSLILVPSGGSDKDKDIDERKQAPPESAQEHIRNAEELVCLTFLGFAQNMLGRIRTMALAGLFLFVATTLAVSSYPFDPRPALSGVLLVLFVMFGAVIVFVYADMHRDSTLSHITNTNPGELGSEFWFKIIGFGAAPLIGLITTIFPDLSGFLFSWLQPGLTSLK